MHMEALIRIGASKMRRRNGTFHAVEEELRRRLRRDGGGSEFETAYSAPAEGEDNRGDDRSEAVDAPEVGRSTTTRERKRGTSSSLGRIEKSEKR